jgi:hypothetical protein
LGNRAGLEPSDRAWSARRIALVLVTAALLSIAIAVGLVVGGRFLAETPIPRTAPGTIVATGDIPVSVGWLIRPAMARSPIAAFSSSAAARSQPRPWSTTLRSAGTAIRSS